MWVQIRGWSWGTCFIDEEDATVDKGLECLRGLCLGGQREDFQFLAPYEAGREFEVFDAVEVKGG